jgi:hypothetical protein
LNEEDINQLNSSITNELKIAIKSLPKKKSTVPDRVTAKFYQTFKRELTLVFLKLYHKTDFFLFLFGGTVI